LRPTRRSYFILVIVVLGAAIAVGAVALHRSGSQKKAALVPAPRPSPSLPSSSKSSPHQVQGIAGSANVYAGIAPGNFSPAVQGDPELVYVPCGDAGIVEVIDPHTYKVIDQYKVGLYPEHVTPSWDLKHLYVDVAASSRLAEIDPATGKLTGKTFHVPHPYNLYFTPDGSAAISVYEVADELDFRDPSTFHLIKAVPIPGSGPDHMDFTADGRYALLTTEFDGNIWKIDTKKMRVVGSVHVGGLPVDVKLSPDGSVFYVANQGLSGVSVIDPNTMKQTAFIRTGKGAHGMAISRDAKLLYVTNRLAGTISVIDFATSKVIHTWNVGASPDMVQVSPDGTQLWVSNRYDASVSVVDATTGNVIKVIKTQVDPHGLAYFPQPGNYSLGHNGVYR
jgi:YVTN family beta-propeller protein